MEKIEYINSLVIETYALMMQDKIQGFLLSMGILAVMEIEFPKIIKNHQYKTCKSFLSYMHLDGAETFIDDLPGQRRDASGKFLKKT